MTCIAGLVHDGQVYIGADSAGVDDRLHLTTRADRKVFKNGEFVIGFTTSFRMGQLLRYSLTPPIKHPSTSVFEYMATDFIDAVRKCLTDGQWGKKCEEQAAGGTFLVGYSGRLFTIEEDYQIGESLSDIAACGAGDLVAIGALSMTDGREPINRLTAALTAAEKHMANVRGPFFFETTAADSVSEQRVGYYDCRFLTNATEENENFLPIKPKGDK